ncbi:hypothetical protein EJP67_33145 [Variovorax guangxiensis]|uniref:Uncharacterized protein n=1 Tax=Variovorax guangxiensis TaxID=1775474 RepID=A0A3S0XF31_9BURK|nr:hypothetical protein [Variovorax guangxiensis]RUR71905.1 hypothetical protein EJP67_33145 [Variovorax guangxiensis]
MKTSPWHFKPVTGADGKTTFDVFDGDSDDPIVNVRKESSAIKIVDSANKTGYPDVSAMVDDEED